MEVPHLTTALTGPLLALEKHLLDKQAKIECWLRRQWHLTRAPYMSSVDLRNAGFKLAPVDTNLFPAGFNNLNPEFLPLSIQAVQSIFQNRHPDVSRILIIPESHTRNVYYLENLYALQQIFIKAGFQVMLGTLIPEITKPNTIELPSGHSITLNPITHQGEHIVCGDFIPELILLNNDLSEELPDYFHSIRQPIAPPLSLGWSKRYKSKHFTHYNSVVEEFAKLIDIDPWLINPLFRYCGEIDFLKREGEDCLIYHATQLFQMIEEKYREYDIKQKPFLIIKADQGTYGMGIMMIQSVNDITQLNRKQRTQMSVMKGRRKNTRVIIQEGVHTFEQVGSEHAVAEPVVYLLGQYVIGGFYRVHKNRGQNENLNSPGMEFEPLAFAQPCNNPHQKSSAENKENRFYAYGVIARLATLAAARELQEVLA